MGQSNMVGQGGNNSQAPQLINGAGLEFNQNTNSYTLSALTEPLTWIYSPVNNNGTIATSFINAYYSKTNTPVVAVMEAIGGSWTQYWIDNNIMAEAKRRFNLAKAHLNDNGITVRNSYMVWLQGESDADSGFSKETYKTNFNTIYNSMKEVVSHCFMIKIGYNSGISQSQYDVIMTAQEELCNERTDLTMVSRIPQTFIGTSYMVDNVHYNQLGLNMVGEDAGNNAGNYVLGL